MKNNSFDRNPNQPNYPLIRKVVAASALAVGTVLSVCGINHLQDNNSSTSESTIVDDADRNDRPLNLITEDIDPGFTFIFEEGENPDTEALQVAGINPGELEDATSAQREIYMNTRDAIERKLGALGIEATQIPVGYELRLPQDPNMD